MEKNLDGVIISLPSVGTQGELLAWIGSVVRSDCGRRLTEGLIGAICDSTLCSNNDAYEVLIDLSNGSVNVNARSMSITTFLKDDLDLQWHSATSEIISKKVGLDGVERVLKDVVSLGTYAKGDELVTEITDFLNSYDGVEDDRVDELKSLMVNNGLL